MDSRHKSPVPVYGFTSKVVPNQYQGRHPNNAPATSASDAVMAGVLTQKKPQSTQISIYGPNLRRSRSAA